MSLGTEESLAVKEKQQCRPRNVNDDADGPKSWLVWECARKKKALVTVISSYFENQYPMIEQHEKAKQQLLLG